MTETKKTRGLRQQIEEAFHDTWARTLDVEDVPLRESFEAVTAIENSHVLKRMGDIVGKRILDLGCGMGDAAVYLALQGAGVDAVDISSEMVDLVRRLAQRFGLDGRVRAGCMAAERLEFPDETFDFVYGNGTLHHIDIDVAVGEVLRVLKPGGMAFFIEPLAYNPVINVYRRLAAKVRTETEKPLTYRDIRRIRSLVPHLEHSEFHLCTLLVFLWFYLVEQADPSEVRYWKKILVDADKYRRMFKLLYACDRVLLKVLPPLRPLCWNTVLVIQK